MRNSQFSLTSGLCAIGLALSLGACGGTESSSAPQITIGFSSRALAMGAERVRIAFHPGSRTCEAIEDRPGIESLFSEDIDLTDAQKQGGGDVQFEDIRSGTYTVVGFAAAGGMDNMPIGFGCAPNVTIEDGVNAEIELMID